MKHPAGAPARRLFLGMAAIVAFPLSRAQKAGGPRRVGWLGAQRRYGSVQQTLQRLEELGYAEGRNLAIDFREADTSESARQLVASTVELIVAWGIMAAISAREATQVTPIVMVYGGDPVETGLVASLARPGNVTGLAWSADTAVVAKYLEIIVEGLPGIGRVGWLWNESNPLSRAFARRLEQGVRALGLRGVSAPFRQPGEISAALSRLERERVGAVIVLLDNLVIEHEAAIVERADALRLPLVSAPGLSFDRTVIRYGPRVSHHPRRAAEFIARILDGARPGELPIEQADQYELVVDLRIARKLGVSIADALVARADRVVR